MTKHAALIAGEDSKPRCSWCVGDSEYIRYHDEEWGMPVVDDRLIFEKICLEGFQSGLSWLTILRKRPAFRIAFKNFDPELVTKFNKRDIERLMNNAGIVRHRGKIEATIQNARASLQMQNQGISLAKFVWSFCPENTAVRSSKKPSQAPKSQRDIQSKTPESQAMSKSLRKLGFKFVGETTMYAAMQSLGVVNDHYLGCHSREKCDLARTKALKLMLA
jgi:DNA-3-methyladenine glycosylase I